MIDHGDRWILRVPASELRHPVVLTTMMARALGHVLLVEALPSGAASEAPAELTADYAAVALGFGPLLLEGAYIYSKGCGGPQVAQLTHASLPELAVLTALFVEMRSLSARHALRELGTTQTALLGEALEWAKSNRELCSRLAEDPARIAASDYTLADTKPWLLRIFGKRKQAVDPDLPPDLPIAKAPSTPKLADPEREELRALVDEALSAAHADAS